MAKIYKKNSFLHRNSGSYAIFVDREIIFLRKTSEHDEKNTKRLIPSVVCGLFSTMMLPGCIGNGTAGGNEVSVDFIPMDTTVYLDEANTESPKCQIKINFKYLKSANKNDSLTQVINQVLEDAFSSAHAGAASPQAFVSSIKESLAGDYLKDVQGSYQTDLKNGMKPDEIPNWYNYEYEINSELQEGKDSIWNYAVTTFQYTGGAHPNTWHSGLTLMRPMGKSWTRAKCLPKELKRISAG